MTRRLAQSRIIEESKVDRDSNLGELKSSENSIVEMKIDGTYPTRGRSSKTCIVTLMGVMKSDKNKIIGQVVVKKASDKTCVKTEPHCI